MTHADKYYEMQYELAGMISKLKEMKERCERISDEAINTNCDPEIDLDNTILAAAQALSSLVIYENEFRKEEKGENNNYEEVYE